MSLLLCTCRSVVFIRCECRLSWFGFNTMGPLPFLGVGDCLRCNNFTLSQKWISFLCFRYIRPDARRVKPSYYLGLTKPPRHSDVESDLENSESESELESDDLIEDVPGAPSPSWKSWCQPTDEKGWKADVCSDLDYIICKESNDFK